MESNYYFLLGYNSLWEFVQKGPYSRKPHAQSQHRHMGDLRHYECF